MDFPPELRYSSDHEWVRLEEGRVRVGITDYAQDALGDVVFVDLPDVGAAVDRGATCSEVESTKSVSEIYAPVSGTVVEVNTAAVDDPSVVNGDPFGAGWLLKVDVTDVGPLLTAEDYAAHAAGREAPGGRTVRRVGERSRPSGRHMARSGEARGRCGVGCIRQATPRSLWAQAGRTVGAITVRKKSDETAS